jgi:hypothetical protein
VFEPSAQSQAGARLNLHHLGRGLVCHINTTRGTVASLGNHPHLALTMGVPGALETGITLSLEEIRPF